MPKTARKITRARARKAFARQCPALKIVANDGDAAFLVARRDGATATPLTLQCGRFSFTTDAARYWLRPGFLRDTRAGFDRAFAAPAVEPFRPAS